MSSASRQGDVLLSWIDPAIAKVSQVDNLSSS